MNYTKMKFGLKKGIVGVCILGAILLFTTPLLAQTNGKSGKGLYELFSTKLPDGAQWVKDNKYVRKGGYSNDADLEKSSARQLPLWANVQRPGRETNSEP